MHLDYSELKFLNYDEFVKTIEEVTTPEIFLDKHGHKYHPSGLFSEQIFGLKGSKNWANTYAYINLKQKIIHPIAYDIMLRLNSKVKDIVEKNASFDIDEKTGLFVLNENGQYHGIYDFIRYFDNIKLTDNFSPDRLKLNKLIYENKNKIFTQYVIVIPPQFRPINVLKLSNEMRLDEMNEFYINILRAVNELPTSFNILDSTIKSNYVAKIHMIVYNMAKFIEKKLGKKQGYFRSSVLGKRVDHSSRSVIVGDPNLPPNKVILPFRMVIKIYEPFILHHLMVRRHEFQNYFDKYYPNLEYIEQARKVLTDIYSKFIKDKELIEKLKEITKIATQDKVVCLKRDPALHRDSWRAFYFDIGDDSVIHINHTVTEGFNADFDGDQMAVYALLTEEAQEQAKKLLMPYLSHKGYMKPDFSFKKDIFLGLYILTKDYEMKSEYKGKFDYYEMLDHLDKYIILMGKKISVGRAIINLILAEYVKSQGELIDYLLNKKTWNKLYDKINSFYDDSKLPRIILDIQKVSYKATTLYPHVINLDDLMIAYSPKISQLKKKLLKTTNLDEQTKIISEMKKEIEKEIIKSNSQLYATIQSGAGGKMDQMAQMLGAKGLVGDVSGKKTVTISNSFADGLSPSEFFTASNGARKGLADRTLNTANTGYLTRKLVYALSTIMLDENKEDCGTKRTLVLPNEERYHSRILGRYHQEGNRLILITKDNIHKFKKFNLRSPIYCQSVGICKTCYGKLYEQVKTPHIGILAGTTIGERGTQLIMRTFHTGGIVSFSVRDLIKELYENQNEMDINQIRNLIYQDKDKIYANDDLEIEFDIEEIDRKLIIYDEKENITIPNIVMKIKNKDIVLEADMTITLLPNTITFVNNKVIKVEVKKNDLFAIIPPSTSDFTNTANEIISYLNRTEKVRSVMAVLNRIFRRYETISDIDLVHIEVLISNLLRYEDNMRLPARLGKVWKPIKVGVKKVTFLSNWKNGMMFENINKAIQNGLMMTDDMIDNNMAQIGSSLDILLEE